MRAMFTLAAMLVLGGVAFLVSKRVAMDDLEAADSELISQERPAREIVVPGSDLFSRVVRAGDFLFLAGALGRSRSEENGPGPETRRALESIEGLLEQAGATKNDLVKCTVFLADFEDYGAMNEVYGEFFEGSPPARTALGGSQLFGGASLEIECMAYAPEG